MTYIFRLVTTFLLTVLPLTVSAKGADSYEHLYRKLDLAIAHSHVYKGRHDSLTHQARQRLAKARGPQEQYRTAMELFRLYQSFKSDSALYFLDRSLQSAQKLGDHQLASRCKVLKANEYVIAGLYLLAGRELESIDTLHLDRDGRSHYFATLAFFYSKAAQESMPLSQAKAYANQFQRMLEKVVRQYPPADKDNYYQQMEYYYIARKEYGRALKMNTRRLAYTKRSSRNYAIVAYYRYVEMKLAGKEQEGLYWLITSSICDIQHAVYDQGALWELANHLFKEGDRERSYRYISYAWDCVTLFGSHSRNWEVSKAFQHINRAYQQYRDQSSLIMKSISLCLAVLIAGLLVLVFFYIRQHKKLKAVYDVVSSSNQQLSDLNEQLKEANRKMAETNKKLNIANQELRDYNQLKEVYIGKFLQLCTVYIDRMDKFRHHVNVYIQKHLYKELYDETRQPSLKVADVEELFTNFDAVFLRIFPDFIEQFNALLRPEGRIETEPGHLNIKLRIFALIRLGIDDSQDIAHFLHYSVRTVYNYRSTIRNFAIGDKEHFEDRVREII